MAGASQSPLSYEEQNVPERIVLPYAYLRAQAPEAVIAWSDGDPVVTAAAAEAYLTDPPDAELHDLDAGYFALETKADEGAALMRRTFGN